MFVSDFRLKRLGMDQRSEEGKHAKWRNHEKSKKLNSPMDARAHLALARTCELPHGRVRVMCAYASVPFYDFLMKTWPTNSEGLWGPIATNFGAKDAI